MQYGWLLVQFIPFFIGSELFNSMTTRQTIQPVEVNESLSLISVTIAFILMAIAIGAGVYAVIKGPAKLSRKADTTTDKAVTIIIPTLTAHKKLTDKQRFELSKLTKLVINISLAIIGFGGLWLVYLLQKPVLDPAITLIVGLFLLPWAILWFSLGYILYKPKNKKEAR